MLLSQNTLRRAIICKNFIGSSVYAVPRISPNMCWQISFIWGMSFNGSAVKILISMKQFVMPAGPWLFSCEYGIAMHV